MDKLSDNWLTSGIIDFEYKKYLVLGYLQHVQKQFDLRMIYPELNDVIAHIHELQDFKAKSKNLYNSFPKNPIATDMEKMKIVYESITSNDPVFKELEDIVSFALPAFSSVANNGKNLYELLEEQLQIEPIGLTPLHFSEGYVAFEFPKQNLRSVYYYVMTVFLQAKEKYRAMHLKWIDNIPWNLGMTYSRLKVDLSKRIPTLPNPAMFVIQWKEEWPFEASVLPVAKRTLTRTLMQMERNIS